MILVVMVLIQMRRNQLHLVVVAPGVVMVTVLIVSIVVCKVVGSSVVCLEEQLALLKIQV